MSTNSVLKRLKTEAYANNTGVSNMEDMADLAVTKSESEDVANNTSIAIFTEDILPSIFDNLEILTAHDLLNFRLVNRCWRDAATSVLLKRNMCEIQLDFGRVAFDEAGNSVAQIYLSEMSPEEAKSFSNISPSDKFFNSYQPSTLLADLNQVISTSPKFPSTRINFFSWCSVGFGNASLEPDSEELNENQKDLLNFLKLYGKQIKTLSLCDDISKKAVQNLLYVHMPHVTCLDFRWFDGFLCADEDDDEAWEANEMFTVFLPPPSTLQVQEIRLAPNLLKNEYNFVKNLFNVCPNLSKIQSADISMLEDLLKMGKCHLIQSLRFDPRINLFPAVKELFKYDLSRLQLSVLTVQLSDSYGHSNKYDIVCKLLNLILSATKDSLKCLELTLSQSNHQRHIFIPQLPHLRRLKLDCNDSSSTTQFYYLGDVIGEAMKAGKLATDHLVADFLQFALQNQTDSNISTEYFPRLRQLGLKIGPIKSNTVTMTGSFPLEHCGPIIPGNTTSKMTAFELGKRSMYGRNLSHLFPNITRLQVTCGSFIELENWIWTAYPKLERFEIRELHGRDRDTNYVDSFFTGISPELCATLGLDSDTTSAEILVDPAQVFERTMPYIGDCKNLRVFQMHFDKKLSSNLASKIAAIHGFQQVIHRTEIQCSFFSEDLSVDEIQGTLLQLILRLLRQQSLLNEYNFEYSKKNYLKKCKGN